MYKIPASTLFLGKNLVFVPECHSTNTLALQLCQNSGPAEGTLVITPNQTAGRGQRGNGWEAEPGKNFTFSLILKPATLALKDQFYLNIFTSLALRDYLAAKGCTAVRVKWPNDIYVGSKKICGILVESQISGNKFSHVVVGIGLNVNQQKFGTETATSLSILTGMQFDLQAELESLLKFLEARYLQLREGKMALLMEDYLKVLYGLNTPLSFEVEGVLAEGMIVGVDESGRLRVLMEGRERVFGVKEVGYGVV
ncbi:BirA family transcriptional regulator, biotin operon repressor / biotin-[acetyl-CoA-carboxylase] ligase [Chryseolinea serpens]|uniref:BirA family transcriptional regulator, biotin operon repressor / biotin-[acetyl-CoA-carboxylase] ligase n=1 Tax=Chryseolinea serpens TaxID=947013 RepID=A0A1M5VCP9_9BACT|nr:biotin--[acetyl-CoA-carboxylase] ligase [Chryseolinea serpens]SHH72928.1 BirA family transcriptional regulator, biotin operon repressor / biotin-[acetyl-CoA-carboxylase] ligase [Chryseolinea serpens]